MLGDIAVLTGGQFISEDLGLKLENVELEQLGKAKTVRVEKESCTHHQRRRQEGRRSQKRIDQIRAQMEQTESEYDKEKFSERLAKLTGGVAIIRVGGATEAEMKQTKGRVEDALHATRAAVAEGILPGGGVGSAALHPGGRGRWPRSSRATRSSAPRSSLELWRSRFARSPRTRGVDGAVVADEVRQRGEKIANIGYNANTGEYVDMFKAGIVDPTQGDALGAAERRQHRRLDADDRGDDHQDR